MMNYENILLLLVSAVVQLFLIIRKLGTKYFLMVCSAAPPECVKTLAPYTGMHCRLRSVAKSLGISHVHGALKRVPRRSEAIHVMQQSVWFAMSHFSVSWSPPLGQTACSAEAVMRLRVFWNPTVREAQSNVKGHSINKYVMQCNYEGCPRILLVDDRTVNH